MTSPKDLYAEYVALIRDGFTPLEATARQLAEKNNLPLQPLNRALDQAYSRLLILYINEVEEGRTFFAEPAYEIARRRNFSVADIDDALAYAARSSSSASH